MPYITTSDGVKIYYEDHGQGETLLFSHGMNSSHLRIKNFIDDFKGDYRLVCYDHRGHGASERASINMNLQRLGRDLRELIEALELDDVTAIGHSMGGYYAQCFMERYPGESAGFVSIDSGPMQKHYMTEAELWSLEHTELMYRSFPWSLLLDLSARGCATSEYGRRVCRKIFEVYGKDELCRLLAYGFHQVAKAIREDLPYQIDCPCVLICGKKDHLGVVKSKNRLWARETGYPIHWIEGAGHCSNLDAPDEVNGIITKFLQGI